MVRKKKKENRNFSGYDLEAWLVKTEKRISNIQYGKDFENLKPIIIKMLSKIKKEPKLVKYEPRLVLLLKDCNLNMQFIRRNEDCWALLRSGNPDYALEEIIHALKDLNTHPDKYLIRPDIKGIIIESVKKISEKVESGVKILPSKDLSKSSFQTINPTNSSQSVGNTFKPKLENLSPFDISAPNVNPFEYIEDEKMIQKDKSENFDTYFHPKNLNPNESEFESSFTPFPGQDAAQKLSNDQMNSINTYWSKEGVKEGVKEEKVQNNNSPDIKTQKITKSNQGEITVDKKKKTDNPWPDA